MNEKWNAYLKKNHKENKMCFYMGIKERGNKSYKNFKSHNLFWFELDYIIYYTLGTSG